ncbi:MAG TPA: glycosyltransferase [Chondromyces sp.]|nr:glycosyltransferase [Chondromyces sp.]
MKTIIILSGVKYNSTKQRPHHMASFFAKKGYRVIYISLVGESKVINEQELNNIYVDSLLEKYSWRTEDGIFVLKRILKSKEKVNDGLEDLLGKLEDYFKPKDVTFIVAFPDWMEFLNRISNECKLIYDCMDDWESFVSDLNWGYTQKMIQNERKLASTADLVIASARRLYTKMSLLNEKVYYLPNGVWNSDYYPKFNIHIIPQDIGSINKPIVFFMGAIAGWVDTKLIKFLAESRPNYSFVFIGSRVKEELPKIPNVYFLGHKKYEELPFYLSQARVAIIPFKVNKLTAAVTPLKFYEYLSSSTPVITTIMPDLLGLPGSKTALNYEEFLNYVDNYVNMERNEYELETRKAISTSKEFDWNILLEPLCSFIEERDFRIPVKNEFINTTIKIYENYKQNDLIKNELLTLYNSQSQYDLSCKLIQFKDIKYGNPYIDYINMALAYIKENQLENAIILLKLYVKSSNLLTVYLDSLIKEKSKKIFLEIFLLKLSGNIYEALRLTDDLLLVNKTDSKLLGMLCGLYLDLGEYDIALHYAIDALNNRGYLRLEEVLDITCITFLINYLLKQKNYELAKETALSLMKINKEWEEKAVELLSDIYLSKHMSDD